ncbi:MAG: GAF domain-containing protein [Fimbriimonadaceae bacterium]
MVSCGPLLNLAERVATVADTDQAMRTIVDAALRNLPIRHAMIAILSEEHGRLDLRWGAGAEWDSRADQASFELGASGHGIVAQAAATAEPILVRNVDENANYRRLFESTRSELAAPIWGIDERIRGVFNVESDEPEALTAEYIPMVNYLAALAATVLEREDSLRREDALVQVGEALHRARTEEELIEEVIRVAGEVLRFQAFSLFLFDKPTQTFVLRGSVGRLKELLGQISYGPGDGCTGWVCGTGKPIRLANPSSDPRWRGRYVEFPSEEISSFLCVPIVSRGRCIGALRAVRRKSRNPWLDTAFTTEDQRILQAIADQMAVGLENIRAIHTLIQTSRMVAWGELSAKSSHMIGNRVFALRGDINELGHLLSEPRLNEEALKQIQESLVVNLGRIDEILQEFRDFLTATQLHRETVQLNDLVQETVHELYPKRSQVELNLDLAPDLPEVIVDQSKLRRAISEVIENALIHTKEGAIIVRTSLVHSDELKSRAPSPGTFIKIDIEDTGVGVASEQKERIFEPFFSTRVKGMGLGLSIVKGIVDAHGGAVYEYGNEGSGAKFAILIPVEAMNMEGQR